MIRIQAPAAVATLTTRSTARSRCSRAAPRSDETTWEPLDRPTLVAAGGGFTRLVLVDAGRGRVVPCSRSSSAGGSRCDQVLAASLAGRVLEDGFGLDPDPRRRLALRPFSPRTRRGLRSSRSGSMNLEVTALAAMSGDPRLAPSTLHWAALERRQQTDALRSRRLLALAGLAALGDPVLQDVRAAAAQPDLTIEEQVNVALAALFAGDEYLARFDRAPAPPGARAATSGHGPSSWPATLRRRSS